ncbi:hypothetical protein [Stackebrandtia soli]|uniref:hypothetical protein n=1 Tax=Stackebrandtia soli TaxID=1892856 RepID=UPI0039E75595
MMEIKLEKQGRILSGFYEGYYIKFHKDSQVTGGYYVFLLNHLTLPTDGGDFWEQDWEHLEEFVKSSEWEIEWLEDGGDVILSEPVPGVERGDQVDSAGVVVDVEVESMPVEVDEDAVRRVLSMLAEDDWSAARTGLSMLSCVPERRDFAASLMKRGDAVALYQRRVSGFAWHGGVAAFLHAIAHADVPEVVTFSFTNNEAWTCVVVADPDLQHPIGSVLIPNEKPSLVTEPGPGSCLGCTEQ